VENAGMSFAESAPSEIKNKSKSVLKKVLCQPTETLDAIKVLDIHALAIIIKCYIELTQFTR